MYCSRGGGLSRELMTVQSRTPTVKMCILLLFSDETPFGGRKRPLVHGCGVRIEVGHSNLHAGLVLSSLPNWPRAVDAIVGSGQSQIIAHEDAVRIEGRRGPRVIRERVAAISGAGKHDDLRFILWIHTAVV